MFSHRLQNHMLYDASTDAERPLLKAWQSRTKSPALYLLILSASLGFGVIALIDLANVLVCIPYIKKGDAGPYEVLGFLPCTMVLATLVLLPYYVWSRAVIRQYDESPGVSVDEQDQIQLAALRTRLDSCFALGGLTALSLAVTLEGSPDGGRAQFISRLRVGCLLIVLLIAMRPFFVKVGVEEEPAQDSDEATARLINMSGSCSRSLQRDADITLAVDV